MNINNKNKLPVETSIEAVESIGQGATLIVSLIHLGAILKEYGNKHIFAEFNLDVETFETLFIISQCEETSPSELSKYSLMHPAKTTRVLDRLEEMSAIERIPHANDRRSYTLRLTKKGEDLLSKSAKKFQTVTASLPKEMGRLNFGIYKKITIEMIKRMEKEKCGQ